MMYVITEGGVAPPRVLRASLRSRTVRASMRTFGLEALAALLRSLAPDGKVSTSRGAPSALQVSKRGWGCNGVPAVPYWKVSAWQVQYLVRPDKRHYSSTIARAVCLPHLTSLVTKTASMIACATAAVVSSMSSHGCKVYTPRRLLHACCTPVQTRYRRLVRCEISHMRTILRIREFDALISAAIARNSTRISRDRNQVHVF